MQVEGCRGHAVVYIEAGCCLQRHEAPPAEVEELRLAPFDPLKVPNGNGSVTQLLPQVRRPEATGVVYRTVVESAAPIGDTDRRRHRKGDPEDDEPEDGLRAKDLVLGAMIGAALTVFLSGLLIVWLIG